MIDHVRLTAFLRQHFRLQWDGLHGAGHWARVLRYAKHIAEGTTSDAEVLTLFALLHDSCRESEDADPGHGPRAALLARELNGSLYRVGSEQEEWLVEAIEGHSDGNLSNDLTIQICWDADRLDLARLGVLVRPEKLSAERALAMISEPWPYKLNPTGSLQDFVIG